MYTTTVTTTNKNRALVFLDHNARLCWGNIVTVMLIELFYSWSAILKSSPAELLPNPQLIYVQ